jgi:signal peptidase I
MTKQTKQDAYALVPEGGGEEKPSVPPGANVADADPQPSMTWMLLRELVETVVLSLVIFLLIRQVVQNYRIESHSMEPNFVEGEFILVNKLAFRLGAPERGDVVVFHNPNNTDEDYIKRVIGLPGDTVEVYDQTVFINGKPLQEDFPHNEIARGTQYGPQLIEPGQLFVMGDNRPHSSDSREFGPLNQELMVGKAWVRVWPLTKFGAVQHYDLALNGVAASSP